MRSLLLAIPTVGAALALEDTLRRAGANVVVRSDLAEGPGAAPPPAAVVVLDADFLGANLIAAAEAWRSSAHLPGLIAVGDGDEARAYAPVARVTLLAGKASSPTLVAAIQDAYRLRLAGALSWAMLCAATDQPAGERTLEAVAAAVRAARHAPLELARTALAAHAQHYVTGAELLHGLLEERRLSVPEQALAAACDGTLTLQSAVRRGPLEPASSAQVLWALACAGAIELTAEVRDVATTGRRALAELRHHLAWRKQRLAGSTYYDVLEVTPRAEAPQIEEAYRLQAVRYAPRALAAWDLAEHAAAVQPLWELVEKARATLCDLPARGRYHDWLRSRRELSTVWAIEPETARLAAEAFARGQRALGEGEIHRAVGELAAACRHQPGHPEYEATLAWARFRVQVAAGHDRSALARRERLEVERVLAGARPWPRALLALALLCAADGDAEAARWHVQQALAVEPSLAGALALRERLGSRRQGA